MPILFFMMVLGSCLCACISAEKKRDALWWTIAGAACPSLAVAAVLLAKPIVDPEDIPDRRTS